MSSTTIWIILAIIGVAIIIGLGIYAVRLTAQVKQQQNRRDEAIAERNARLTESIVTIAKAVSQGQCDSSEGALRLVVLLDLLGLEPKPDFAAKYPAIHDMYDRIKHMPTHETRKKYPREKIRELDKQREGYEKELDEAIQNDANQLLTDFS